MSELEELKQTVERLKQQLVLTATKQVTASSVAKDLGVANLVDSFKGDPNGILVNEFFQQLDDAGEMANWTDEDKIRIVALKIKGAARRFFSCNPNLDRRTLTYSALKKEFIERFRVKQLPQYNYTALQTAVQRKDESPEMFADRCRKLCEQTVRQVEDSNQQRIIIEEAEHRLLAAYINGLQGVVGQQVRFRMPATMTEAIQIATTLTAVNQNYLNQRTVFSIKCYNCKGDGHTSKDCKRRRFDNKPQFQRRSQVTCYRCNKTGHIAARCRSNPNASSSAQ